MLVLFSLLFGLGSWVAITGLWLEVPVLIHHLPEGWSLASYLTFVIQLANIAPLIYWYFNRKYSKYCNEVSATNLQLLIGILACTTLILYWNTQTYILGAQHSVVLLACAFALSIVDCLSSITFLPFMARFKSVYLTPYLIGEGLSGFLPSILAIVQNIDDNYNPPEDYITDENSIDNLSNDELNSTTFYNYNYTSTNFPNLNANLTAMLTNLSKSINHKNYTMNNLETVAFRPELFFVSLLVTLVISWIAFFYLQFHQPNHVSLYYLDVYFIQRTDCVLILIKKFSSNDVILYHYQRERERQKQR